MPNAERAWITFTIRLAFGFFFLFAAINIFSAGGPRDFGPDSFARTLSKGYETGWTGEVFPMVQNPFQGVLTSEEDPKPDRVHVTYVFLFCVPFIFTVLAVPIILGIFLRPALRVGAILLVILGLGKYMAGWQDLSTTAHDFFFAFLICVALYFLGQQRQARESGEPAAA